jgi:hypothetical protein
LHWILPKNGAKLGETDYGMGHARDTGTSDGHGRCACWHAEHRATSNVRNTFLYGGCHGSDEKAVFEELCQVVEEAIALYHKDGKALPPQTSGRDYANKMQDVA